MINPDIQPVRLHDNIFKSSLLMISSITLLTFPLSIHQMLTSGPTLELQ